MSALHETGQVRREGLDVARGVLLLGMVAVHVVSAHATAGQSAAMHEWFGIFLISAGFVGLSGFVLSTRTSRAGGRDWARAVDGALHLILVMVAYGVLISLLDHGLGLIAGASGCADDGWRPPLRFEDLGILLPIALVRLQAPLARTGPARIAIPLTLVVAVGWTLMPELAPRLPQHGASGWVVGVLAGRTLTPFYTVSTFVGIGLACAALAQAPIRSLHGESGSRAAAAVALIASVLLAMPPVSSAILDPIYALAGSAVGAVATLAYWTGAIALFLRGFAAPALGTPRPARRMLASVGAGSLLVFVSHDVLLQFDAFARSALGADKGLAVVAVFVVTNVLALALLARAVERSAAAKRAAQALLLSRPRGLALAAVSPLGALWIAAVLAAYSGAALAGPSRAVTVDDFEREDCPRWWSFGDLDMHHAGDGPAQGEHYLAIRGKAPGMFAHGRGVFLDQDASGRGRLVMDVRGYGPGSGRIKIELSEDDNGNWEIEKDPRDYTPIHDDRLVYELSVDWRGWREIQVPLDAFRDDNPKGGNNVFDPERDLTSGGLLELQLMFAPSGDRGDDVTIDIDDLRFSP